MRWWTTFWRRLLRRPPLGGLPWLPEFDDYEPGEWEECERCDGDGVIVTCIDDLCANSDECMHGDGYGPCPECRGAGFHVMRREESA